jgi:hypothetical protein
MQALGSFDVRSMSFFLGMECAKIDARFVVRNLSLPTARPVFHPPKTADAFKAMSIPRNAIGAILSMRRKPEIAKSVIGSISIYVIDLLRRLFSRNVEPSQSVGTVSFPIDLNVNIPFVLLKISCNSSDPNSWARKPPTEDAGIRRVVEDGVKVRMFHDCILPDRQSDGNKPKRD